MRASGLTKIPLVAAILAGLAMTASAGPVIIDGTDANDHGTVSAGVNLAGWEYMQRALENLAGAVDSSVTKVVVDLGTTGPSQARSAIDSAFALSTLPGLGWTIVHVDGAAAITAWLTTLSTANTGILYIPTAGNSSGDLLDAELLAINGKAAEIAAFVNGPGNPLLGGGLFSMGESPGSGVIPYGWLTSVIPGIVVTDVGGGGVGTDITLTAAGTAAFPGLTNADLVSADPWHNYFTGSFGSLSVLGTALQSGTTRNIILGGGAGTTISNIPEPGTLVLLGLGLAGTGLALRRRRLAK